VILFPINHEVTLEVLAEMCGIEDGKLLFALRHDFVMVMMTTEESKRE